MDWEGLFNRQEHPDNIIVEKTPVADVAAESDRGSKSTNTDTTNSTSKKAGEESLVGQEADMLLEDEGEERKRPDVFAMFVATKKKTESSFTAAMATPRSSFLKSACGCMKARKFASRPAAVCQPWPPVCCVT